jgi:hypothetical protein
MAKDEVTAVRHQFRRNTKIITEHGELQIDEHGLVSNLDDLDVPAEALVALPEFEDASAFYKPSRADVSYPQGAPDKPQAFNKPTPKSAFTDDDYLAVVRELLEDANAPKTSEGYIDMNFLNAELRKRGFPILSGSRRKIIQDRMNLNVQAPALDQNGDPVLDGTQGNSQTTGTGAAGEYTELDAVKGADGTIEKFRDTAQGEETEEAKT